MNCQEKLDFCKKHLGEEVQFSGNGRQWGRVDTLKGLSARYEGSFLSGSDENWKFCRPIPKPKLIPWTLETAESVQLRHKNSREKVWFNYVGACAWFRGAGIVDTVSVPYYELLRDWETVDGRPCGTEVME